MPAPWERYQAPAETPAGPWARYGGESKVQQEAVPAPVSTAPPGQWRGGRTDALVTGARDPIDAGAQLLPRGLQWATSLGGTADNPVSDFFGREAQRVDQMVHGNEADYQSARAQQGREGFDALRLTGNVVSPANLAIGARAAQATRGLHGLRAGAASVPVGATLGLSQPVVDPNADFASTKMQQGIVGGALGPVAQVAGKIINPVTDDARALLQAGVKLTPGQMLGNTAKRIEDAATSLPIVGDAIRGAQRRSIESFNVAAANQVLADIGQTVPKGVRAGHDLFNYAKGQYKAAYDGLLPRLTFTPDKQFWDDLTNVGSASRMLAKDQREQLAEITQQVVARRMAATGGVLDGQTFKTIESELGQKARKNLSSAVASERELGDALNSTLAALRSGLMRSNPNEAPALQAINRGYAHFATFRDAAGKIGAQEGVFTPAQFLNAVRNSDKSVGKGRFAGGNALMQDFAGTAKSVLPSTVPDSGTPLRLGVNALALGMGPQYLDPTTIATSLGAAGLYTQPGQAVMRGLLAGAPQVRNPLASLVSNYGPVGAVPAALPLLQIGQE